MGSLFSNHKENTHTKTNKANNQARPSRKDDEITEKDRAILDLKNSKDRLKKYKKKLESESEKLTNQAKQHLRLQQKDRALLLIKLKKMKEQEVDKLDKQLLSVMDMINNIEWEATNIKVMKALQEGNQALNHLHNEMSYEDVVSLLDETNEAIEVENQINELLAGQFNPVDETELQKELAELMGESVESAVATGTTTANATNVNLPNVPTHAIRPTKEAVAGSPEKEKKVAVAV